MECCFDSFSIYIHKRFPALSGYEWKLLWCNSRCAFVCFNQACLPAVTEYTVLLASQLYSLVVNYLLYFDQSDIIRRHMYPFFLHSEGQGHLTSL